MRAISLLVLALPLAAAQAQPLSYSLTLKPAGDDGGPVRQPLLPSFHDRVRANSAVDYLRAALFREVAAKNVIKFEAEFDKALERSPRELKGKEIEEYIEAHKHVWRALEAAAAADHCDWQIERGLDMNGMNTLTEEVQRCRGLATALRYRIRWSLGRGDLDAALRDIQTGMTMGRHVGEGPTLIVHLVGIAIESVFLGELAQVMQTPGTPNFYRALAMLPSPFLRNDAMIDGERRMMEAMLGIGSVRGRLVSQEEAIKVLTHFARLEQNGGEQGAKKADPETAAALAHTLFDKSFERLKKRGYAEAELKEMSQEQVAVLDVVSRFRGHHDEMLTLMRLQYPESITAGKLHEERHPDGEKDVDFVEIMSRLLTPAISRVRAADIRLDRQIAMLRVIEAVRLYAAEHDGQLPAKLNDVASRVSLPRDPATTKPFDYKPNGKRSFTLTAPPYDGNAAGVGNSVEYRVTVAP
jgi:hypothetical protein